LTELRGLTKDPGMLDLSLGDQTQVEIGRHLRLTEQLLAQAASIESGRECEAEIALLPDLGMPYNVLRVAGGFFTGAVYQWESDVPLVPIDATVNCCGVSLFELKEEVSPQRFLDLIGTARRRNEGSSYVWNLDHGNHFVMIGSLVRRGGTVVPCALLHSSAAEFKKQVNGLYPTAGNWYADRVRCIGDTRSNRFLRYISGSAAERFFDIASHLSIFNRIRHQYFAELIFGHRNVVREVSSTEHYGMPSVGSVAIGCQWFSGAAECLLLTARGLPIFVIRTSRNGSNKILLDDCEHTLYPHGMGMMLLGACSIRYRRTGVEVGQKLLRSGDRLKPDVDVATRVEVSSSEANLETVLKRVLALCPGVVVGSIKPVASHDAYTAHT